MKIRKPGVLLLFMTLLLMTVTSSAQTVEELYGKENYKDLIGKYGDKRSELTARELYCLGYAYYMTDEDETAVKCFDLSIEKGFDFGYVYFQKGMALRYAKEYDKSVKAFDQAIKREPSNQKYVCEKALAYYYNKKYEKALDLYKEALSLPAATQAPHYMIPHIYSMQDKFDKALELYYEAVKTLTSSEKYLAMAWSDIGGIELKHKVNFENAAAAFRKVLELKPRNYPDYPNAMKAFNGAGKYASADSLFQIIKTAYDDDKLEGGDFKKYGTTPFAITYWKERKLVMYRYFRDPKKILDINYKVYLFTEDGEIDRTFQVEMTLQLEDGPRNLLCEQSEGSHRNYGIGWKTDVIPVKDLFDTIIRILDRQANAAKDSPEGKKKK